MTTATGSDFAGRNSGPSTTIGALPTHWLSRPTWALEIARTLGARLREEEIQLLKRTPTKDPEAYDAFRRAVVILRDGSLAGGEQWKHADELLERALARDPSFALATAWLSLSTAAAAHMGPAYCEKAGTLAEHALAVQPDLPEAHAGPLLCLAPFRPTFRGSHRKVRTLPDGDSVMRAGVFLNRPSKDALAPN